MDKSIYSLIKEEYIKELDIKAYHLEHIKSGAEILCLKCKDYKRQGLGIYRVSRKRTRKLARNFRRNTYEMD